MKATGKPRAKWQRRLWRPFIYMTFTRFILALAAGLLVDFFFREGAGHDLRDAAFLLLAFLFALLAVVAWLRLDGVKLPKLMMLRINPRKKPARTFGDMADFLDEQPMVTFEDLDDGEKDLCLLAADLVCMAGMFIAALVVTAL